MDHKGLRRTTSLLLFFTLWLILWGAYTNSLRAGMAFPDWPTSDGAILYLLPVDQWSDWQGERFWEHSHRLIAGGLVGPLTVVIFVWSMIRLPAGRLRKVAALTLICVIIQGLFGAQTVREHLSQKHLSIGHGVLAQVCIALMVTLRFGFSAVDPSARPRPEKAFAILPWAVFGQTLLGALYRHQGSTVWLIWHVVGALLFSAVVAWVAMALFTNDETEGGIKAVGGGLLALLLVQLSLGAFAWVQRIRTADVEIIPWTRAHVASFHVLLGSVFMALAVWLYWRTKRPQYFGS